MLTVNDCNVVQFYVPWSCVESKRESRRKSKIDVQIDTKNRSKESILNRSKESIFRRYWKTEISTVNIGWSSRHIRNLIRGPAKSRRDFVLLHINVDMFLSKKLLVSPCEKTKNRFFCAKIALSVIFGTRYHMPCYYATYNFCISGKISLRFRWSSNWIRNCVIGTRDIASFRGELFYWRPGTIFCIDEYRFWIDILYRFCIDSGSILCSVDLYACAP